jgi:hypothetical protein
VGSYFGEFNAKKHNKEIRVEKDLLPAQVKRA